MYNILLTSIKICLSLVILFDPKVNGQFYFSEISLQSPISSIGSNVIATANVTYLGSSGLELSWKINHDTVEAYWIEHNQIPRHATLSTNDYNTLSSTTASVVNTGDTFSMILEIKNVSLDLNNSTVSLSCAVAGCITQVDLSIKYCQPSTGSGVIATISSAPCGFGCTVQYSCASGYTGNNVTATCQEDATFDAIPICTLSTCPNSDLPCSNHRYCFNQTGSSNGGSNVTVQCNTGYSGSVSATCGNDGNWTITPQSPCPAVCSVSDITSSPGRCTTATGDILEGQNITVTCCNGYEGVSTMSNCTSDRSWSNLPTCTKAPGPLGTTNSLSTSTISISASTENGTEGTRSNIVIP